MPFVKRKVSPGTHTKVETGVEVWRRQLSQWQCATKRDGMAAVKRTAPQWHRPLAFT